MASSRARGVAVWYVALALALAPFYPLPLHVLTTVDRSLLLLLSMDVLTTVDRSLLLLLSMVGTLVLGVLLLLPGAMCVRSGTCRAAIVRVRLGRHSCRDRVSNTRQPSVYVCLWQPDAESTSLTVLCRSCGLHLTA